MALPKPLSMPPPMLYVVRGVGWAMGRVYPPSCASHLLPVDAEGAARSPSAALPHSGGPALVGQPHCAFWCVMGGGQSEQYAELKPIIRMSMHTSATSTAPLRGQHWKQRHGARVMPWGLCYALLHFSLMCCAPGAPMLLPGQCGPGANLTRVAPLISMSPRHKANASTLQSRVEVSREGADRLMG